MSSVRRIDEDETAESSYQLGEFTMEDGDLVLYDTENCDAWLQADEDHAMLIDGRWR